MFVSYAQNFEDVLLWRALGHIESGFYIDIGAQDPVVDSISLSFYERGWRGVHVEPTPAYAQALREARPDETVLQAAIGNEQALIPFFEIPGTGISTGDAEIAQRHETSGFPTRRLEVPCIKLSALLDGHKDRDIHWMKIDVEGMEQSVLQSWAPSHVRPWIVVVESTIPLTSELSHEKWEASLVGLGYRFAYFDGLNRFYVSRKHRELLEAFKAPPNVFDRFSLAGSGSHLFCDKLNEAVTRARREVDQLNALRAELEDRLNRVQHDEEAGRARVAELERRTSEQAEQTKLHVQESLISTQHLADALRGQEHAKSEALELLRRLAAKGDAHERQMAAAQEESTRLMAELTRQREDAVASAAQRQGALESVRARLDATLSELRESEASRLREAKQGHLTEREHASRIQALTNDRLLSERALQDALGAAADTARILESALTAERRVQHELRATLECSQRELTAERNIQHELRVTVENAQRELTAERSVQHELRATLEYAQHELTAERNAQHELRATLENAKRELGALQASWMWRIGKPVRFLTRRFRTGEQLTAPPGSRSVLESPSAMFTSGAVDHGLGANLLTLPRELPMSESTQFPRAAESVEQLLSLHDDEFVRCAYLTVLRRPADTGGFANYLAELRQGTAKEKILVELADSPEGRSLGDALPGLKALVLRVGREENSLVHRVRRQLGWQSRVPMETQLRRMENTMHRMGAEGALRLNRIESEVAIIKQLVRHGTATSVYGTASQRTAESPAERSSVLASSVTLTDPSPSRVVAGIARQLAESREAEQLFVGSRSRQ